VQTRRDGNSATVVARREDTEVSFGGLCACVTLHDLGVSVTMNPDEGKWRDVEWARRKALDVILTPETVVDVLAVICKINRDLGKEEGKKELRQQISCLLGVR